MANYLSIFFVLLYYWFAVPIVGLLNRLRLPWTKRWRSGLGKEGSFSNETLERSRPRPRSRAPLYSAPQSQLTHVYAAVACVYATPRAGQGLRGLGRSTTLNSCRHEKGGNKKEKAKEKMKGGKRATSTAPVQVRIKNQPAEL